MRKEEAMGIQDKQVHFPPEPEADMNLGANLVHLSRADFRPLSSQLGSRTGKGEWKGLQVTVSQWTVGRAGGRRGEVAHPWALISPPGASTALPDFIFVASIMLQCHQYGSREQMITDGLTSTFSFRTLVISQRFPLWTEPSQRKMTAHLKKKKKMCASKTTLLC